MRATGPTALGIMMTEEWTVEVKTTGPRLAGWRSVSDMTAERQTEGALGMKAKKLENREVIQRDPWQVGWVIDVANVRASPELPSCADSRIAKSQRYTNSTKHTLCIQPLPAKFQRQV